MRSFLCILLAGISIVIATAAGKTVDFSGIWILDPTSTLVEQTTPEINQLHVQGPNIPQISDTDKPQASSKNTFRELSRIQNLQILQTESEIQAIRRFLDNGQERTILQKFKLDGSQCLNLSSDGRGEFASRSSFKNNKLIHSGSQTLFQREQRVESYVVEEYSLSKNGKKLTIKTSATGSEGVAKIKQVYIRQQK
jgi:hypothetical protein